MVVRSRLRGRIIPGSKSDSTKDPWYIGLIDIKSDVDDQNSCSRKFSEDGIESGVILRLRKVQNTVGALVFCLFSRAATDFAFRYLQVAKCLIPSKWEGAYL
ncbi:hypothetical protein AVEN_62698-1 [Araneus ventricosus]|uniref:Uncharacterized protein n=1 Tax=Araneus ventricosus TaxID=182803 RepID=A0A4Y2FK61_ARAVE|nr:hypothetical protein AVEN_62698-1 [Araneus ventricosus]